MPIIDCPAGRFKALALALPLALLAVLAAPRVRANVVPALPFQDHAVLQAGKPLPVWGRADPGERVTVRFAGQQATASADAEGRWRVTLAPLAVNASPARLLISGNNALALEDVLVGEVWLCAGQSNMAFRLREAANAGTAIAGASYPLIRQLGIGMALSNTPAASAKGRWITSSPATAGEFSAVGYFFAHAVQQRLGVPVGIVNASWGGTEIEAWLAPDSYATHPQLDFVARRWQQRLADAPADQARYAAASAAEERKQANAEARGETYKRRWIYEAVTTDGLPHQAKASNIYNGMVAPLAPMALAGVLWYQGESNATRAQEYGQLFPALITGWRGAFGQGELPFYWVQLPNFGANPRTDDWVGLRASQARALELPATAQAIAIDIGEQKNIHPLNKQDVGRRLALIALRRHYGQDVVDSGPEVTAYRYAPGQAIVSFDAHGGLAGGLADKPGSAGLSGFEVAGADGVYHAAQAAIDGDSVLLRADAVAVPVAARYAWSNAPLASLFNRAGLPARPFSSAAEKR